MAHPREKAAIVIASITTGLFTAFHPPAASDPVQREQSASQSQNNDLSDADEHTNETLRQNGDAHADAENARRLVPVEPIPSDDTAHLGLWEAP